MSATINRMPTSASFQIAQSNNPTNNGKPTDLGKGEIQGVGPDGKVYKTQLILRIKDGSGESQYFANGKALPKNLSEAEAKVYVRQQISKGMLGALEPGNRDAFKTKSGTSTSVGNTNKQRRSFETMEQAVKNNRIPPGTAVITLDKLVSGLQQPSKDFSLGEAFWGTESGKIKGALHMGAISINRDTDERIKNPGFHYDEKTRSVYFANSQDGAQAYVNFMREFSKYATDGGGKNTKEAEKFIKEGLPQLTDQFGPKMMAGFKQVEKNQAAFQKGLDDSGLTTLGKIQTGLDIVGGITGRPVPVARPAGRKAVLTAKTPFANVPGVASKTVRSNPNNSNTPRQILPTKPTGIGTNGTVLTPPKVKTKPIPNTPPVVTGQNGSTNPIKNTSAERPYKPVPQVAPLIPSKSTGKGFGTNTLRTTPSKVKATAPTTPATPAPVTSRSDWSFGSIKVNKPAAKPSNAPVATPQTRVIDPFDAKNSIPGATPAPGGNNVVPIKRKATSGDGTVQGKTDNAPGNRVGINPNDPTAAAAATAGSRTPNKPSNPGGTATATLEAPAAQQTTVKESQAVPVLGEVTAPPLLKPNTAPAGQPEAVPVTAPVAKPLLKPLSNEKDGQSNLPLIPTDPGAKPNLSSAASPGSNSTPRRPVDPLDAKTTSTGFMYEPSQYNQTDFATDISNAKKAGGGADTPPSKQKTFYFMDVSNKNTGPKIIDTTDAGRAEFLQSRRVGSTDEPAFLYLGRLDDMPAAALVQNRITVVWPPNYRNILQGDEIQSRAGLQARITVNPESGNATELLFGNYRGKDLKFAVPVSEKQGKITRDAFAGKLGDLYDEKVTEFTKAFQGNGSIGKQFGKSANEIDGYARSAAYNFIDVQLSKAASKGSSPLVGELKKQLSRDKFWKIFPTMPDVVLNTPNKLGPRVDAATVRTMSAFAQNPVAPFAGAAVLIGLGKSGWDAYTNSEINKTLTTAQEDNEVVGPPAPKQRPIDRDKVLMFESPIDNPAFDKKWGKYAEIKNGVVVAWKRPLFDAGKAQELTSDLSNFYAKKAEEENSAIQLETTGIITTRAVLDKKLNQIKGVSVAGSDPNISDPAAQNPVTYTKNPTFTKYQGQINRQLAMIAEGRKQIAQITTDAATYVPGSVKVTDLTGVNRRVAVALENNLLNSVKAQRQAELLNRTAGVVPASKDALNQQINVIRAGSQAQEQVLLQSIKESGDAIESLEKATKDQRLPTNTANQVLRLKENIRAAELQLNQIPITRDSLILGVENSYNGKIRDVRTAYLEKARTFEKEINLANESIASFDSSKAEALTVAGRSGIGAFSQVENLTASNGFFKVKQSVLNNPKYANLMMSSGWPPEKVAAVVEFTGGKMDRDVNNQQLVPRELNSKQALISTFADYEKVKAGRETAIANLTRVQADITRLDSGGTVSPTPKNNAPTKPLNRSTLPAGGGAPTSESPKRPAVGGRTAEQDALKKKELNDKAKETERVQLRDAEAKKAVESEAQEKRKRAAEAKYNQDVFKESIERGKGGPGRAPVYIRPPTKGIDY